MTRLLGFRQESRARRQKLVFAAAVASCLVIAVALIAIPRYRVQERPPAAKMAVVSQTVNPWDAGTMRGEQPGSLQSVSLAAALVKLTIILPRFSPSGQYVVAVTRDPSGNGVLAQGSAAAFRSGNQEEVSVELDLSSAKAGTYFLSTTREQGQASYYYPLQIK